jgi:predicted amidophosphoribosyltransferase
MMVDYVYERSKKILCTCYRCGKEFETYHYVFPSTCKRCLAEQKQDERREMKLPYDFDLHFDIKTEEEMYKLHDRLKSDLKLLEDLMKYHGYKTER